MGDGGRRAEWGSELGLLTPGPRPILQTPSSHAAGARAIFDAWEGFYLVILKG